MSMRHRPYSLIFTVSLLLVFASIYVVKAILEFATFNCINWKLCWSMWALLKVFLGDMDMKDMDGFGEHHFYWLAGACNTEWNKGSKPGVVSCLLWKADELSSAFLGTFHWLLLWLIQAASAKMGPLCLPLLSSDMCSVRGLLTSVLWCDSAVLPSRMTLQWCQGGCEGAAAVGLGIKQKRAPETFQLDF